MFEFHVSANSAVLELELEHLLGELDIYNDPVNPTEIVYLILPFSAGSPKLYWDNSAHLTGPKADLVILMQNDLVIIGNAFTDFPNILVSDNEFHQDGKHFVVIEGGKHTNHSADLINCRAVNAYFLCSNLRWAGGAVQDGLYVSLSGKDSTLVLEGSDDCRLKIGDLILPDQTKPNHITLKQVTIQHNLVCDARETLSIDNVQSGAGLCKLAAEEIKALTNFYSIGEELRVKAANATIGSFLMPVGKVYLDVDYCLDFRADGDGRFQGIDLYIDLTKNIDEKELQIPFGIAKFDKILVKGAKILSIPGTVIAETVELTDCLTVHLNKTRVGHLKYETSGNNKGNIVFGKHTAASTNLNSLWLIGKNDAIFRGPTEIVDLDSEGKCHLSIYHSYKGKIIKLNLNLDPKKDKIESARGEFIGIRIDNPDHKTIIIDTILAKLNTFNINGSVDLGQVICQPFDPKHNIIDIKIDVSSLKKFHIGSFFAGFDHDIVVDTRTGQISLKQSTDRALASGEMFASFNCSMKHFLTIRAGQGLSFKGSVEVINGDIDLFTMFGRLSLRGSLKAGSQIKLTALEGVIDLSAQLNAHSVVTYARTDYYTHDTQINTREFLARVVGRYLQVNTQINAQDVAIISENSDILLQDSNIQAHRLQANAHGKVAIKDTNNHSAVQQYAGYLTELTNAKIEGDTTLNAQKGINISNSVITGMLTNQAVDDIGISGSHFTGGVSNHGANLRVIESKVIGEMSNNLTEDFILMNSCVLGPKIETHAGGQISIHDSAVAGSVIINDAKEGIAIQNSNTLASNMANISGKHITIEDSQILSDNSLFFKAVSSYLAVNSNITITQRPYKLFMHNCGAVDSDNNPVLRCGLNIRDIEVLGIIDVQNHANSDLRALQYSIINSGTVGLELITQASRALPKGIFIDSNSGTIIGSALQAKDHQVIVKTKQGLEVLPLGIYNSVMLNGGFKDEGIKATISKIEAGFINIDGGKIINLVGALLRANNGQLQADYFIDSALTQEILTRQQVFREITPWLKSSELYEFVIDKSVVPTKLEFSEVTKIDLGKDKINVFYPYQSKKVFLTQKEGDVQISKDVDFSKYELMAINASEGQIFFGAPKMGLSGPCQHIEIKAQDLSLEGNKGIELHGEIAASGTVQMHSQGKITIAADHRNFGQEIKQSVVKGDNVYIMAQGIEIKGSIITVKNDLTLISDNDIKVVPIELLKYYQYSSQKTTTKEKALQQVVSQINAGRLNIDAGRVAEFVSSLITADNLNIHAQDLKISSAKEILHQQIDYKGKNKWWGGKGKQATTQKHSEIVIPTVIQAKNQSILVDHDATLESAKIFAEQDILLKVGNNLTIKEEYNLHVHDYHSKKYSLISFKEGAIKINSNKRVEDFFTKQESVPTIIHAGGAFYGMVGGKMHVLGSKILGKDIHLAVPKGVKLEASKHLDTSVNFVHESGLLLGFYSKNQNEAGVTLCLHDNMEKLKLRTQHLDKSELIAEDTLTIIAKDGTFEQISAQLAAKIIQVEARDWLAKTYSAETVREHIQQHFEVGAKLALKQKITGAVDKIQLLVDKRGGHIIDHTDRAFKAYDAYKSLALLPENAASGGLYGYFEVSESKGIDKQVIAVDNTVNGKEIIARINNDIRVTGMKMTAQDVDIAACNFSWQTSSDNYEYEYNLGAVNLELNLLTKMLEKLDGQFSNATNNTTEHHENYIRATGQLKLNLSGTGQFRGCSLEGVAVDIKADNLILEAVQDKITARMQGANFHIGGLSVGDSIGLPELSIGAETGSRNAAWSNRLAQIVGSQVLNVTVKETLDLAGGLIASAATDKYGKLTEQGELSVNCGRLIVKKLHDYDQGLTLGIGASFQINAQEQQEGTKTTFDHANLKVEYKDKAQEVAGIIGSGKFKAAETVGDTLQRELSRQVTLTKEEQAGFDSVIHRSMFAETAPQKISVKKMLREAAEKQQESAPLQQAVQYASDIVGSFKIAIKDVVQGGAVLTKLFGSKVNPEHLAEQVQLLMGQDPATGLSTAEQQRITTKIEQCLVETKLQGQDSAMERLEYDEFLYQLNQQITKISDIKEKSMLLAARDIYKAKYTKELKESSEQARLLKSLPEFIAHVQHTCLDKSPAFAVIHPHILAAVVKVEQLQAQASAQLNASGNKHIAARPEEYKDQDVGAIGKLGEQEPIIPVFEDINDLLKQQHSEQKLDPLICELLQTPEMQQVLAQDAEKTPNKTEEGGFEIELIPSANAGVVASGAGASMKVSLPLLEAIGIKYGPKVLKGFVRFAAKAGVRAIPYVGWGILAFEVYDLYKTLVDTKPGADDIADSNINNIDILRARKTAAKDEITAKVLAAHDPYDENICSSLRALSTDQLVQLFTDIADSTVPDILGMEKHLPVIWKGENVIGILKHTAAAKQNTKYRTECHDYRLTSEQHWKDGGELPENLLRIPGGTKGSQRFDFYAKEEKTIYDLKFGKQGITPSELAKMIKHGEPNAVIKEVRPSRMKTSDQEESIKKVN